MGHTNTDSMKRTRRIVILDSGIGGITVAAPLAQQLENCATMGDLDLIYVDVKPRRGGYNDLAPADQIRAFSSDLRQIESRWSPVLIAIACNTLTAVYEAIPSPPVTTCPVLGIIDGTCRTIEEWARQHPEAPIRIFGTPTTIQSASYQTKLGRDPGIARRLIAIPCPGLPGLMESGKLSAGPQPQFQEWIRQASRASALCDNSQPGLSVLACTHFGLDLTSVRAQFAIGGLAADVLLNPNDAMIEAIKGTIQPAQGLPTNVKVSFSSLHTKNLRHSPALEVYLGATAPAVLNALHTSE